MTNRAIISMVVLVLCTCSPVKNASHAVANAQFPELPGLAPGDDLIRHTGFALVYDEKYEQAKWVAYELTREETFGVNERTNRFFPDPKVITGTATDGDYKKSGYDRGHLAPAADMSWSAETMRESFYFSNISPQVPSFNRGVWKRLEDQVRQWARQDTSVYVATGPVLQEDLHVIGPNRVSVPAFFYKALLVNRNGTQKAIAFILPNKKSSEPIGHFAVTVDSLEQLTGLDFFHALPNDAETRVEATVCLSCWNLQR